MAKTITLSTEIPKDRRLQITLPPDVPAGPAEVTLVVSSAGPDPDRTLGDLLRSEFFGMWSDREDIIDSGEFARRLRTQAWGRSL